VSTLISFDDLARWFRKGIRADTLKASDGTDADSLKYATKTFGIAFMFVAAVEFIIASLYARDMKFDELFGFPAFIAPFLIGCASFVGILLACLWATRAGLKARVASSLTLYVLSGVTPILAVLLHAQLGEAIQLFTSRRDPSLDYLRAATIILLQPKQASTFAVTRAWAFCLLEVAAAVWYLLLNLRRVLADSTTVTLKGWRVTIALIVSLALNAVVTRYYTGRLFWLLLGRLLS
jgi:hypothetical protein